MTEAKSIDLIFELIGSVGWWSSRQGIQAVLFEHSSCYCLKAGGLRNDERGTGLLVHDILQ